MWNLQLVILIALMFLDLSLQDTENKEKHNKYEPNATVGPKTFNGVNRGSKKINYTEGSSTQGPPELDVPNERALEYLTGILSTRVVPAAYVVAMAVGIPANAFVLACLGGRRRALPGSALYLTLAASDLLLLLSLAPLVHYHLGGNRWAFGEAACRLIAACFYGNVYGSVHAHACVSALRYLAVTRPFLYRGVLARHGGRWAALSVWVVCAVAAAPELLVRHSYRLPRLGVTTCHDVLPYGDGAHGWLIPYRLALICLGFFLPAAAVAFAYASIVRQLGRSSCDWARYVRASTLVFVIFLVCIAPSSVIHFAHYVRLYASRQDDLYAYYSVAVCLCCFHSCLDPFLSYLLSRTTRSRLQFVTFKRKPPRASVFS